LGEETGPAGPRALLRDAGFRRVWLIGLMTGAVRWSDVLVTGIYIFDRTGSARDVALVMFLRFLPMIGGALSGSVAALLTLGRMLRLGLGLLLAVYATLAALDLAGALAFWQVALGAFLSGLYWSTENSVRRTLMGEIAGPERTSTAIGMDWATISAMRLAGPIAGSAIYAASGVGACYAVFAGFYLAAVLLSAKVRSAADAPPERGRSILATVLEDIRIAWRDPRLAGVLAVTVSMNFFGFSYASMVPVIGKEALMVDPVLVGLLSTGEGVGALLAALGVANLRRARVFGPGFLAGSLCILLGALAFSLSRHYPLSLAALTVAGMGSGVFATLQTTLILINAPPERRSRTMGVLSTAIGTGQLGVIALGMAATWLGAPAAVALFQATGIALLGAAALAWPAMWRKPAERPGP